MKPTNKEDQDQATEVEYRHTVVFVVVVHADCYGGIKGTQKLLHVLQQNE
jgi:hypothetical protein